MNKGLEALRRLKEHRNTSMHGVENDFAIIEKELKALEIIKKKKVFVANLIYHFENDNNVLNYNSSCGWAKSELRPEEYELLKEILL